VKTDGGWAFIVNPVAGNGYGAECAATVREMMRRHGAGGEVVLTERKGHATELAAALAGRGFSYVVGVGGDGTLSEVAQGLAGRPGVTFGAVAAGTGNDFIHILGFPNRFEEAQWGALFAAETVAMDVGRCNGRLFINGMGLGFDAQVAYENYHMENGGGVRRGSKAKYTWHIVKNIFSYHEKPMTVTIDGRTEQRRSFLNTIANGRRLAGGLELTPKAFADDGFLDYCSTDPLSIPRRLKALVSVTRHTHLQEKGFHYAQADRIGFSFEKEVPAHLDGELIFAKEFIVDVLPGALRAIYDPAGGPYLKGSPSPAASRA
jgi:diacylglycerol kinase (ATP)